jgi:hypothetical protein|tara:strand:- start:196 stop:420 length:225 start_codon:yes stop_codon:yes gene_type:complete
MTLPELIDNLIELSCNEMPDEARDSLDDAIDHIVSSLNDVQLKEILKKGMSEIEKEDYEKLLMKSILNNNLAFA